MINFNCKCSNYNSTLKITAVNAENDFDHVRPQNRPRATDPESWKTNTQPSLSTNPTFLYSTGKTEGWGHSGAILSTHLQCVFTHFPAQPHKKREDNSPRVTFIAFIGCKEYRKADIMLVTKTTSQRQKACLQDTSSNSWQLFILLSKK